MKDQLEYTINELINTELWSSALYLNLKSFLEEQNIRMLASWLDVQVQKKMNRIHKMTGLLIRNGGTLSIRDMDYKGQEWKSPLEALNMLLEHEHYIDKAVQDSLSLAMQTDPESYLFIKELYCDNVILQNVFLDLIHVLAKECKLRLPFGE